MRERLLVIDSTIANRIVMKAKLSAAYYDVTTADDVGSAINEIKASQPDLILLSIEEDTEDRLNLCKALKVDPDKHDIPLIVTAKTEQTVSAFEAGADDVITRPVNCHEMLSRLRKLLRARDRNAALKFESNAAGALKPAQLLRKKQGERPKGAVTIAASDIEADLETRLSLLSELRSRRSTRHARIMVLLPPDQQHAMAGALDMGADDAASELICASELAMRMSYLVECKHRTDHLRRLLHDGLKMASTDPLTGLHNRRFATHRLGEITQQAKQRNQEFAVLVLDIDHFKRINDTHGHHTGDAVLSKVADVLRGQLRDSDLLARIGGEEFLVALPDTTLDLARATAERLRRAIEALRFAAPAGPDISITLSIGLTTDHGKAPVAKLIGHADRALYASKAKGRNRVSVGQAVAQRAS